MIEHAQQFRTDLPAEQQADLDGLLGSWIDERERVRKKMLRLLDSKHYERLQKDMKAFLDEKVAPPDQSAGAQPYQVRHLAGSAIWSRYEAVRASETIMDQPTVAQLHALRITGKYLRYTLEFFSEVLAADAKNLIRDIVSVQDKLGALHDADVASELIRGYIEHSAKAGKKKHSTEPPVGLIDYLHERENAVKAIQADFASTWQKISGTDWRLRLATLVAAL